MSSTAEAYASIGKRDFHQAIVHLLETAYKIIGSHRVVDMIATDIVALMEEYYPHGERVKVGEVVWTTSADSGRKPGRGQRIEDSPPITVHLPWVTAEDLAAPPPSDRRSTRQRNVARAVRLVKAANAAGGLLTLGELGALFNLTPQAVGDWLNEHYQRTGEVLPTKGQIMDIGKQPSHKDTVIYLYEQKVDAVDIARRTRHHQASVDRYIADYERVKLLLVKGMSLEEISHAIGRALSTVRQYDQLVRHYHPESATTPLAKWRAISQNCEPQRACGSL